MKRLVILSIILLLSNITFAQITSFLPQEDVEQLQSMGITAYEKGKKIYFEYGAKVLKVPKKKLILLVNPTRASIVIKGWPNYYRITHHGVYLVERTKAGQAIITPVYFKPKRKVVSCFNLFSETERLLSVR